MSLDSFHLISLGCAKNTVDSESMASLLIKAGYQSSDSPEEAGVLIVNTCGFIGPAKEESLQVLGDLAKRKRPDQLLIAAGCLTQRYGAEITQQIDGIDGILGTRRWMDIVQVVRKIHQGSHPSPLYHLPPADTVGLDEGGILRAAIQGASAYLKIADGCRRPCAFCAIPLIKGTAVSRPRKTILEEVEQLQEKGVKELILIAQDTTDYGHDLGERDGLARLLKDIVQIGQGIDWIRILYAYPGYVTEELIRVMADQPQVLPYLDMPLQHAHPDMLKKMRRPANMDWVFETIEKMRARMPTLALRSTFVVGYPGETETEFRTLLDFVSAIRFDRVGVFTFSYEPGTFSEQYGDPIPQAVKDERRDELMLLQQRISLEKNQEWIGKKLPVLIEGKGEGLSLGRSFRDAPEIDGLVLIEGELPTGEFVPVRIDGALPYDLTGVVENQVLAISVE
jgi:ribosomal protein S12 methylthiotransferase